MFERSIPLFNFFGFHVRLDPSWFFLALLIIWMLSTHQFPSSYPGLTGITYLWMGIFVVIGLFSSIVLHEFSHAWVARGFGIPMRGITLFIFGGVAEMTEEPPSPLSEFWMALAGPGASLVLLLLFTAFSKVGVHESWPIPLVGVTRYLATMNGFLILFNMVPAFPMDGGRVLRALLWAWKKNLYSATRITSLLGSWFGGFLIFLGVLSIVQGVLIGGMWWVLIGFFLRNAASASFRQLMIRKQLEGIPVSRFIQPEVIAIPSWLTLRQLVEDYFYRYGFEGYPVVEDGNRLIGYLPFQDVQRLSPMAWKKQTVGQTMRPVKEEEKISADSDAAEAFSRMQRTGIPLLMVIDQEQLAGVLSLQNLLRILSAKIEL